MSAFRIRTAGAADEPFLGALFRSTRMEALLAFGWSEAQVAAFCDMQYAAQSAGYRSTYEGADYAVIEDRHGRPIGRVTQALADGALVLVDIALLPVARGQGIGTTVVRVLQDRAAALGVPLVLSVDLGNPAALRLYRRLGFEAVGGDGMRLRMRWQPNTQQHHEGEARWIQSLAR